MRFSDPEPKRLLRRRHRDHVHMVGHKAVRPDTHTSLVTPLRHQIEVDLVVLLAQERRHATIAPLGDVMRDPWHDDSG